MLSKFLLAWALVAFCVVVHATGVTWMAHWFRRQSQPSPQSWLWILVFIRVASWIIVLHLIEVGAFAMLYTWQGALPDLQSALYFSAVTYTTTGYGDLVLPSEWRLVGSVEALAGILMCGWSTAFFLALVSRMFEATSRPPGRT